MTACIKIYLTFFNIKRILELLVLRLTGINFEIELLLQ